MKHHRHKVEAHEGEHHNKKDKVKTGGQHVDTTNALTGATHHHKKGKKKLKGKGKKMLRRLKARVMKEKATNHHLRKGKGGKNKRKLVGTGAMMMRYYKDELTGKRKKKRKLKAGKKKHRKVGAWHLVKKNNGNCKCTQRVRGKLAVKKFATQNDCENNRHGC